MACYSVDWLYMLNRYRFWSDTGRNKRRRGSLNAPRSVALGSPEVNTAQNRNTFNLILPTMAEPNSSAPNCAENTSRRMEGYKLHLSVLGQVAVRVFEWH